MAANYIKNDSVGRLEADFLQVLLVQNIVKHGGGGGTYCF